MKLLKKENDHSVKKEEAGKEMTYQAKYFTPAADIFETEEEITLELEVPGVNKESIQVSLDNGLLNIDAQIDLNKYKGLKPIYTEYNIGHYSRRFELTERIEVEKISATVMDGVLTIILPKAAETKPRKIEIK